MKARILTTFGPDHYRLAKLWARGLEVFWPDHPPALILSDGNTTAQQRREVARLCHGEAQTEAQASDLLLRGLDCDIADMALSNFWVRNLYLPSLSCEADVLVWDDVDGLFLQRPTIWIRAIDEHPEALATLHQKGFGIQDALVLWYKIDPAVARSYEKVGYVHGTHSAPPSLILDHLPLLQAYHRRWFAEGGGRDGSVCELGAWQGIASMFEPYVDLLTLKYQVDCLSLRYEPELYHSCSEKNVSWFWQSFLVGYDRHVGEEEQK